jgi:hypothetical protein
MRQLRIIGNDKCSDLADKEEVCYRSGNDLNSGELTQVSPRGGSTMVGSCLRRGAAFGPGAFALLLVAFNSIDGQLSRGQITAASSTCGALASARWS